MANMTRKSVGDRGIGAEYIGPNHIPKSQEYSLGNSGENNTKPMLLTANTGFEVAAQVSKTTSTELPPGVEKPGPRPAVPIESAEYRQWYEKWYAYSQATGDMSYEEVQTMDISSQSSHDPTDSQSASTSWSQESQQYYSSSDKPFHSNSGFQITPSSNSLVQGNQSVYGENVSHAPPTKSVTASRVSQNDLANAKPNMISNSAQLPYNSQHGDWQKNVDAHHPSAEPAGKRNQFAASEHLVVHRNFQSNENSTREMPRHQFQPAHGFASGDHFDDHSKWHAGQEADPHHFSQQPFQTEMRQEEDRNFHLDPEGIRHVNLNQDVHNRQGVAERGADSSQNLAVSESRAPNFRTNEADGRFDTGREGFLGRPPFVHNLGHIRASNATSTSMAAGTNLGTPRMTRFASQPRMERPSSNANIRTALAHSEYVNTTMASHGHLQGPPPRVASNINSINSSGAMNKTNAGQAPFGNVTNQNNSDSTETNAMVDVFNNMKNTPNSLMATMMGKEGNIDQAAMNRMIASAMKNNPVVVQGLIGKMASGKMDPKEMPNAVSQIMQAAMGNQPMGRVTNTNVRQQLDNSTLGFQPGVPRSVRPVMDQPPFPNMPSNRPPIRQPIMGNQFLNRPPIFSSQSTGAQLNSQVHSHKAPIKSPWVDDEREDSWQAQGPPNKKIKTESPIAEPTFVPPVGSSQPASHLPVDSNVVLERNNLLFMDQLRKAKKGGMDVRNMLVFCEVCDDVWGEKAHPVNDYVTHHISSADHCKGLIAWLDVHPNKRYQEMLTVPPHKPRSEAKKSAPLKEKLKHAYFCEVCEVPAGYCKKVYFKHMKLKSHLDKMVALMNTIKPLSNGAKKVEELKDAEYLLVPQRLPDLTKEKNRLKRFPCQICSVAANDVGELTFDNWIGHMTTQFHMSILYDWLARCKATAAVPYQKVMVFKGNTVAEKKDPHYFCEICLKKVKHEDEQYKKHLQSSKHIKNSKALTDEVNKALSGGPVTRIPEEEKKSIDIYHKDIDEEWCHPHARAHEETQQETVIDKQRLAIENEMKQQINKDAPPNMSSPNVMPKGIPPSGSITQQTLKISPNVGQDQRPVKRNEPQNPLVQNQRPRGPFPSTASPNVIVPDPNRQPAPFRFQDPQQMPGPRISQMRMRPPQIFEQNLPRQKQMNVANADPNHFENPQFDDQASSLGPGINDQPGPPHRMRLPPPTDLQSSDHPRQFNPQHMVRNPLRGPPPRDPMRPPNLRPPNMRPPHMRPPDMRPPNMRPSDMQSPDMRPPHMRPPHMRPPGMRPSTIRPSDMRPPDMRPHNTKPPDMKSPDVRPPGMRPRGPQAITPRGPIPSQDINRMAPPNVRLPPPRQGIRPTAQAGPQLSAPQRPLGPGTIRPKPMNHEDSDVAAGPGHLPLTRPRFMGPAPRGPRPLSVRMNNQHASEWLPAQSSVPDEDADEFPNASLPHPDTIKGGQRMLRDHVQMQGANSVGPSPHNRAEAPVQHIREQGPGPRGQTLLRPRGPFPAMNPLAIPGHNIDAPQAIRGPRPRAMLITDPPHRVHVNKDTLVTQPPKIQNVPDSRFKSKEDQDTQRGSATAKDAWMEASERFVQQASKGLPINSDYPKAPMKRKLDSGSPANSSPENMRNRDVPASHQFSKAHGDLTLSTKSDNFQLKRNDAPLSLPRINRDNLQEQCKLIENALNSAKSPDILSKSGSFKTEYAKKFSEHSPRNAAHEANAVNLFKGDSASHDRESYSSNEQLSRDPFSSDTSLDIKLSPPFPRAQASRGLLPTPGKLALLPTPTAPAVSSNVFIQRNRGPDGYLLFPDRIRKLASLPAFPRNEAYCELCPQIPAFTDIVEWVEHVNTLPHMMALFRIAETRRGPLAHHLCEKVAMPPSDLKNNFYICEVCCIIITENSVLTHISARKHLTSLKNLAVTMRDSCAWMREFLVNSKKEFWNGKASPDGKSGAGVSNSAQEPEYDVETGSSTTNLFDFQDPQMSFLHSVLTGVVALTAFKDMKDEGGDISVDLEAKIGREQRVIVEKMCTKSGHLVISIARRVIEKERKEKILEYYPEVKPQFVDIVTGLQPDILKLIADTPILDRPPA